MKPRTIDAISRIETMTMRVLVLFEESIESFSDVKIFFKVFFLLYIIEK